LDGYVVRYGRRLERAALETHARLTDNFIAEAMRKIHLDPERMRTGENWIRYNVVVEMVKQIVAADLEAVSKHDEILIAATEKSVDSQIPFDIEGRTTAVRIGGKLDRIDRRDGRFYVLDYKTGRGEAKIRRSKKTNRLVFDPYALQGLIYARMFHERIAPDAPPPKIGLYMPALGGETLKTFDDDYIESADGEPSPYDELPELLSQSFSQIYSSDFAFRQTDERRECVFCAYRNMCMRN
ncbi:MAG: PD-(D/E)XK nuclease family protein, partial [Bacteroidia bacterium]|nr:PD-(D/E)XK nuclease family protein [Bacteroidia bacterium]